MLLATQLVFGAGAATWEVHYNLGVGAPMLVGATGQLPSPSRSWFCWGVVGVGVWPGAGGYLWAWHVWVAEYVRKIAVTWQQE